MPDEHGNPIDEAEMIKMCDAWFDARPPIIRELAKEFPAGTWYQHKGENMYVIGWDEGGMVICTNISPKENYEVATAMENRLYLDPKCIRAALVPDPELN
jgi:hypothetical protein